ncbi:hypothetical protein I79_013905 [Cricetulus griseus]|uniref:Uncharacterized protein n=1 Tax=Cricetulus griseus TaxID=10029 RepID=G3HSR2_CRIGR|nr:hypothetical protein I79_013905 [Cricetulus griseus]
MEFQLHAHFQQNVNSSYVSKCLQGNQLVQNQSINIHALIRNSHLFNEYEMKT